MNSTSRTGRTALMEAAEQGHFEVCQVLLSNGALPDSIDDKMEDAYALAEKHSFTKICDTLSPLTASSSNNQNEKGPSMKEDNDSDIKQEVMKESFSKYFNVDAKGAVYQNDRHAGLKVIIPPKRVSKPTSITCKLSSVEHLTNPPTIRAGEELATKIIEVGPFMKFNGPIKIEVPHFASIHERELYILSYGKDKKWKEHEFSVTEKEFNAIENWSVNEQEKISSSKNGAHKSTVSVFTNELPQYFAVLSRLKVSSMKFPRSGGTLSPASNKNVALTFPKGADIDIQTKSLSDDLADSIGNNVKLSPLVIIEPTPICYPNKSISISLPFANHHLKGTDDLKLLTWNNDNWSEVDCTKSIGPKDKSV